MQLLLTGAEMKKLLSYVAYPVLVSWPLFVSLMALRVFTLPVDPIARKAWEVGIFLTSAIPVVLSLLILEKKMPYWDDRKVSREDTVNDLTHLAMCWFAISPVAQALMRVIALGLAGTVAATFGTHLWPSDWPLMLQVLLALVVGEFGQYWFHRLGHETGLGWRVHATHHGTPQVYWLNSTRFHAFEVVVRTMFQTAPLIILGCTPDTFLVYGTFTAIHGWVQHSNVAYRTGAFNLIFATSANHRWHHSVKMEEANHNYGLVLLIWDRLFGTFYSPRDRLFTGAVGIGDMPDFPKTYWGQFLTPFRWNDLPRTTPVPAPADENLSREPA